MPRILQQWSFCGKHPEFRRDFVKEQANFDKIPFENQRKCYPQRKKTVEGVPVYSQARRTRNG